MQHDYTHWMELYGHLVGPADGYLGQDPRCFLPETEVAAHPVSQPDLVYYSGALGDYLHAFGSRRCGMSNCARCSSGEETNR